VAIATPAQRSSSCAVWTVEEGWASACGGMPCKEAREMPLETLAAARCKEFRDACPSLEMAAI